MFRNRAFTVSAFVTVVGMFSFVATAYSTSIRLGPVQHQSPLLAAAAFVVLNGVTLVVAPLTSRLIEHVSPRWILSGGLLLTGAGDLWASTVSITDRSLGSLVGPLLAVGLGFALTVTSISAVAVDAVPVRLAGMASGATSLLRDFGFTLGPAVISAVALSRAAGDFTTSLAASAPAAHAKAAAAAVAKAGGPLAVNSAPPTAPHAGAVPLAVDALGHRLLARLPHQRYRGRRRSPARSGDPGPHDDAAAESGESRRRSSGLDSRGDPARPSARILRNGPLLALEAPLQRPDLSASPTKISRYDSATYVNGSKCVFPRPDGQVLPPWSGCEVRAVRSWGCRRIRSTR